MMTGKGQNIDAGCKDILWVENIGAKNKLLEWGQSYYGLKRAYRRIFKNVIMEQEREG